ncbi:hypothetical protein [Candidatus Bathycorpusculum sp.]|uniref:hypothetical protein n=1 Tax=Candidatus Bathycorpusculum sp. TaxID=2994959 RepID=UPI002820022E|nr:hypothetical protein [Candidatus Termitimicrobium sp.]
MTKLAQNKTYLYQLKQNNQPTQTNKKDSPKPNLRQTIPSKTSHKENTTRKIKTRTKSIALQTTIKKSDHTKKEKTMQPSEPEERNRKQAPLFWSAMYLFVKAME